MGEVLAMARKDVLLLLRDRGGMFFAVVFPLVMAVFFGTVFSGAGRGGAGIAVALVDRDSTAESAAFLDSLAGIPEFRTVRTTEDSARALVRTGGRAGFILVRKGFGEARQRMFWGDPPTVEVGIDPARRAEAGLIRGVLMREASEAMQGTFSDAGAMRGMVRKSLDSLRAGGGADFPGRESLTRFLDEFDRFVADTARRADSGGGSRGFTPLEIVDEPVVRQTIGPVNAYAVSFPQGIVWGMISCAATFGVSLVLERSRGTMVRLLVAPLSKFQILAGKAVACLASTLIVSAGLLAIGIGFFGIRPSSYAHLALAVPCVSVAFVGLMMLLSVLGKTERSASGIGWAVLLVLSMIGGGMVPLFLMPGWMQALSSVSPVKWSVLAVEGALWRNFTFDEMLLPCAILLGVGVVTFGIGVRLFRWLQ